MRLYRGILGALAGLALLVAMSPGSAQAQEATTAPAEETAEAEASTADAPTREEDIASFWADRRGIRVLQRRMFEKDGRFQLSLYGGVIPNDSFRQYWPVGLRGTYYLQESIGLEFSGSYIGEVFRRNTELQDFLEAENARVDIKDQQLWRANLGVVWAPIYGKFSFLGTKLAHFDWNLFAGFGVMQVENELNSEERGAVGAATQNELKGEASIGSGFTVWFAQNWAMRIDVRQFLFQKDRGGVAHPTEISLGFSYIF